MNMEEGKAPGVILRRSVKKQIRHTREDVYTGPGSGLDASILSFREGEAPVLTVNPSFGSLDYFLERGIHSVLNNIVVKGAEPVGLLLTILLPPGGKEEDLRSFMVRINRMCEEFGIAILGGHTEATPAVNQPVIAATGVGKRKEEGIQDMRLASCELVMTGWAGQEASAVLAKEKKERLLEHFRPGFLASCETDFQGISVWKSAKISARYAKAMHDITSGGVFGALWELAEEYQKGLYVELEKIPIRQETVEICEFFDINPYMAASGGCLLAASEHGNELVRRLIEAGITAAVIGRVTDNKDKIVSYDGEERCLEPPVNRVL